MTGGESEAGDGDAPPAIQVIVLGPGGGPLESSCTAFLVRSIGSGWQRGSIVAVDAGVQLSAIHRILEDTQPAGLGTSESLLLPYTLTSGPFAGLEVPYAQPSANAAYIHRTLIDTYLITHPHLDHVAGFVINTAGLPGTRPKRLAGLPATISAFKTHIFNNVIWPNLSDENNGAGLVTYMRLVEGGSPALGDGDGKGYLEINDGLAVKTWGVSHGHCIERHAHRGSGSSGGGGGGGSGGGGRYGSVDASGMSGMGMGNGVMSSRTIAHHNTNPNLPGYLQQQSQQSPQPLPRSSAPSGGGGASMARSSSVSMGNQQGEVGVCVYDSSAYSIRDVATGREVIIFGDVEPDSISLYPRNSAVWAAAAPKFISGRLAAIFIECSYDDSQCVDRLFGHLTPRYVVEEMSSLAHEIEMARVAAAAAAAARELKEGSDGKKRKREGDEVVGGLAGRRKTTPSQPPHGTAGPGSAARDDPVSPKTMRPTRRSSAVEEHPLDSPHIATPTAELSLKDAELASSVGSVGAATTHHAALPLKGLKVVIIHVKEKLNDGLPVGETILDELQEYERESPLGCEYILSRFGQSLFF